MGKEEVIDRRQSDGGTYLIFADDTTELDLAIHYAARRAMATRSYIAILTVIDVGDFQHWSSVESMIKREMREKAEESLWSAARKVNELTGEMACFYIREGNAPDVLVDVIDEDTDIRQLILASSENTSSPGPLVSYFTNKGLGRLRVPVLIMPGHLDKQKIDAMS